MDQQQERVETVTIIGEAEGGWAAITPEGVRVLIPADAPEPGIRWLRAGQAVKVASRGGRISRVWI